MITETGIACTLDKPYNDQLVKKTSSVPTDLTSSIKTYELLIYLQFY